MPQTGSLTVRAFTSNAQLPVSGATVIISSPEEDGRRKVLSIQTTDGSGVTTPVVLETPDRALAKAPARRSRSPTTPWLWSTRNTIWPPSSSSRYSPGWRRYRTSP